MIKYLRSRWQRHNLELESQIKELEFENRQNEYALNLLKDVSEAKNQVVDDELKSGRWILAGSDNNTLSEQDHKSMLNSAYMLYHTNLHARAIVRSLVKFVFGKGPNIVPDDDNKKVKEIWEDFKKKNEFNHREKEIGVRVFRDGEVFLRKFIDEDNGDMRLRFIRASSIQEPTDKRLNNASHGIQTDPDDIETPLKYFRCTNDGRLKEVIDAEEIYHIKILSDSDQKRGVSVYRVCAKRLKQYDEWLEDRIALNKVRSAIALIKKVTGGNASKVKSIRGDNLSENLAQSMHKVKMPKRATVITASGGIEYEMLSPNINASDVAEDGRAMLCSIAAGNGIPEMVLTSDFCHDMNTEVLTNYGFVSPKIAYQNQYLLGTVDQDTGQLIYDTPIDWIFSKYNGYLYKFEGNRLNFAVSKNHHMWLRPENSHRLPKFRKDRSIDRFIKCTLGSNSGRSPDKSWRTKFSSMRNFVEPTENILKEDFVLIERYRYNNRNNHQIENTIKDQDRKVKIDDMIEFIGWFVSEGHVSNKYGHINLCQSFINKDNLNQIDSLIDRMPFDFKIKDYEKLSLNRDKVRYWRVDDMALASWLRVNCGVGSNNKRLPQFIWDMPIRLKEKLLDTLIKGDGSENIDDENGSRRYYSNSIKLINDVQRLAFELGYHTTCNTKNTTSYVDISNGHNCMVSRKNIIKENYSGMIWCATVKSGLLVTRRNGRILISGNSNSNYSSSLVAQNPFVREIEDWQDFFSSFYKNLFEDIIEAKVEAGELSNKTKTGCTVEFPPMILADLEKMAKAFEILYKYKIISKKTFRGRMGLDNEIEDLNIDNEDGNEVYGVKPPNQQIAPNGVPMQGDPKKFNLPAAPINQYGAKLIDAVQEADWNKATEYANMILELEEELKEEENGK